MAKFYGQVKGNGKTTASRQGTLDSHIEASVQSYDGSITTELWYADDGKLMIDVRHAEDSRMGGRIIFCDTVDKFVSVLQEVE